MLLHAARLVTRLQVALALPPQHIRLPVVRVVQGVQRVPVAIVVAVVAYASRNPPHRRPSTKTHPQNNNDGDNDDPIHQSRPTTCPVARPTARHVVRQGQHCEPAHKPRSARLGDGVLGTRRTGGAAGGAWLFSASEMSLNSTYTVCNKCTHCTSAQSSNPPALRIHANRTRGHKEACRCAPRGDSRPVHMPGPTFPRARSCSLGASKLRQAWLVC